MKAASRSRSSWCAWLRAPASMPSSFRPTRPTGSRSGAARRTGTPRRSRRATQFELFSKYDGFGEDEYRRLAQECSAVGLDFLTSPFDVDAVEWLEELVPMWKIASGDITNVRLLRRVGETGKPVLLSTGASTLEEIGQGIAWLREAGRMRSPFSTAPWPIPPPTRMRTSPRSRTSRAPSPTASPATRTTPAASKLRRDLDGGRARCARDREALHARQVSSGKRPLPRLRPRRLSAPGRPAGAGCGSCSAPARRSCCRRRRRPRAGARRSLVARVRIAAGTPLTPELLDVKRPGTGVPPALLDELEGVGRRLRHRRGHHARVGDV